MFFVCECVGVCVIVGVLWCVVVFMSVCVGL